MLNEALTSPDADEGIVAALVAVRELLAENGGAEQRLVDVADQVHQPSQVDRLLLDCAGRGSDNTVSVESFVGAIRGCPRGRWSCRPRRGIRRRRPDPSCRSRRG